MPLKDEIYQKLRSWKSKLNRRQVIAVVVVLLFLSPLFLLSFSSWVIESKSKGLHTSNIEDVPAKKVALVLGCSPRVGGGYFSYRMEAAAELWHHEKVEFFLLSGDNQHQSYNEPFYMKEALKGLGVPEERIFLDYAGLRTFDSVVRAKEVFGEDDLLVVSQAFHNKRAIFIGAAKGVKLFGYDAQSVSTLTKDQALSRESLAKVKALLDVTIFNTKPQFLGEKVVIEEREKVNLESPLPAAK